MAKPYNHTEEEKIIIVTEICDRVIEEKISFNKAVKESKISYVTFFQWLSKSDQLKELYNYATLIRSDILFDEMIDIADDGINDFVKKQISEGVEVEILNSEHIQRSRLRIDARKWILAKMQPKKYGERLDLSSSDGSMTPKVLDLAQLSTEELLLRANATNKLKEK